ncbi:hypothetical protein NUW58_g8230 [Xylaria curta]|uniref:Uncharacterized protein n=1 Tax=Xylaria curta TaxID=42375 RepID=A0ACC1NAT9_9PEZI|nr:hypothetical protein NUW58_g8230 [Xylaria curta]
MSSAFASDEVTLAIGHIFKTKTIPIWTLFALQVLLDVQDVMHSIEDSALQNLKWHTQKNSKTFKSLDLKAKDYAMEPKDIQWMGDIVRTYELDVLEDNFRKAGIVGCLRLHERAGLLPAQQPHQMRHFEPLFSLVIQTITVANNDSGSPGAERNEAPAGGEHLNIKITDNNNEVFFKIKRSKEADDRRRIRPVPFRGTASPKDRYA